MPLPSVFISYSHKDEPEKDALVTHLKVLQFENKIEVWSDDRIRAGAEWKREIENAMKQAKVAVLLITVNFLTSDFILKKEVPELLERRQREGLVVIPLIAKHCVWKRIGWLTEMNCKPKNGDPVWRDGGRYADEELARIAEEIDGILEAEKHKAQAEAERLAREKAEQERRAREQAEQEQLARAKAEAERVAREKAEREQAELTLTLAPGVTLELVRVPAGEFLMGSDKRKDTDAYDNELPQHSVHLDTYLIGKYPVTVAQFAAFVQATSHKTTAEREGKGWTWTGSKWEEVKGADWRRPRGPQSDVRQKERHPVTLVSWDDARAFCEWASNVTGRDVRLPSEAEWEKAARGADGRIYPWGPEPPDDSRCNFNMNVGDTTPVGQYSPRGDSPHGCADMAGNVWEWISTLWGKSAEKPDFNYPYLADDGREDLKSKDLRVLRGGGFFNYQRNVRCAGRGGHGPIDRYDVVGFRVRVSPISISDR